MTPQKGQYLGLSFCSIQKTIPQSFNGQDIFFSFCSIFFSPSHLSRDKECILLRKILFLLFFPGRLFKKQISVFYSHIRLRYNLKVAIKKRQKGIPLLTELKTLTVSNEAQPFK